MKPRARKKFGQHFLEPAWADKVANAIDPDRGDRFLEIGPGPGALTLRLAPRVAHLTAIEVDRSMVDALQPKLPDNVTLIQADFLDLDISRLQLGNPFRVAGNLPYNVSSPILFALLDAQRTHASITDATLMLQREVADRMTANPGSRDYGVLSVFLQLHADVHRVIALPPGAFRPAPKVHSALVRLRFRDPAVRVPAYDVFTDMVRAMFTQRRKTIANAVAPFARTRGRDAHAALAAAGIDPRRRPETLQLQEFATLAEQFL